MNTEVLQAIAQLRNDLIEDVERLFVGRFVALRSEMLDGFDGVAVRMDRVESELVAVTAGLTRVEDAVEAAARQADIDGLETRVAKVEERLARMKSRG